MAALSANTTRRQLARPSPATYIVKSSSVVYQGSLVGLEMASGHIVPLDDAADRGFVGIALQNVTGDGTLTCSVQTIDTVLENVSVTGVTGVTDNGKMVYATTDNDLTLTRPADDAVPVGRFRRYDTGAIGDVEMFSSEVAAIWKQISKQRIHLIDILLTTVADGDIITGYKLWGSGTLVGMGVIVTAAVTTASKAADLNAEIAGTNVGSPTDLALTSANMTPLGAIVEVDLSSASGNTFQDGDLLDIEAHDTTAFSEGSVALFIDVERNRV